MARTLPTEESLGLSPSDEELGTITQQDDGDDIPLDDNEPDVPDLAKPGDDKVAAKADDKPAEPAKEPDKPAEPTMVDVRAVQEARAEAREAKQRAAVLEQRWNDYIAMQRQPAPAEPAKPAIPGPDDPMGRLNWTAEQIIAQQEAQQRTATEQAEAQRQEAAYQQAFSIADAEYTAAAAADPSIKQAYDLIREMRGKELLALGYNIPQARALLDQEERQQVMSIVQNGRSIVDHIKTMAGFRGWAPQAAAPTPAPAPKTDLAAVAAAQQRHQSLSDAPGGEGVAPLDAKALAKMTDKEFKAWMSKKGNEDKFDQIMGAG